MNSAYPDTLVIMINSAESLAATSAYYNPDFDCNLAYKLAQHFENYDKTQSNENENEVLNSASPDIWVIMISIVESLCCN